MLQKVVKEIKKINIKKSVILVGLIILLFVLFLSGFSMGKGYARSDIQGITQVARPIVEVENGKAINITNKNTEGNYEFKVKNYKIEDGNIITTDVDMQYYLEIQKIENEAIKIELYKNGEKVEIKENKTENFYLNKGTEQEDIYEMKILYDKASNTSLQDIIQQLQIKVHSEQMKV